MSEEENTTASEHESTEEPNQTAQQSSEASASESQKADWYWDEGQPGHGTAPDYFKKDKFTTAADQLKAYVEAEKKLGEFTGAPEEYNLEHVEIDTEQLAVKELMAVGQELNLSQDGLEKIIGRLAVAQQTEDEINMEEQVKSLGPQGEQMMDSYKTWSDSRFSGEERELLKGWVRSAADLKLLDKIRINSDISHVPTDKDIRHTITSDTSGALRTELSKNLEKFEKDSAYRKQWLARSADATRRNNRS